MITQHFEEKSGQKTLPEALNYGNSYKMFNDGSVEVEVGELLYGFVRILKPQNILETGTYKGWSAAYMAQGLKDNEIGFLDTIEIDQQHIETSKQLWSTLELLKWIKSHHMKAEEFNPTCNYDFIFLDSEPNLRFGELVKFYPFLNQGGYVFIHDCPPTLTQGNINSDHPEIPCWPFGRLPEEIKQWVKEDKLRVMHFPNPRGMTGFYRVCRDEYKWIR